MKLNDLVSGEISTLAFGGEGILRVDGLVIFVPFTAPGDHITCRITSKKKSFARAELIEIIKPSLQRIKPRCPYFGTCGGCQLQHIHYQEQIKLKREWIVDALQRIGKLTVNPITIVPSTLQWEYRRHITLTLSPLQTGYEAGYYTIDNQTILPVNCCSIFIPEEDPVIADLQTVLKNLQSSSDNPGKASIIKQESKKYLLQLHFKKLPVNCKQVCEEALVNPIWQGIAVNSSQQSLIFGDLHAQFKIEQMNFEFSPRVFIQNHPEQSLNIYRKICQIASMIRTEKILDLYCGIGISTILLARQSPLVIGVESNREAIQLAEKNAKKNQISNVSFLTADVAHVLGTLLQKHHPDLVIVNPPRIGLDDNVRLQLKNQAPSHIIYISCNPATLARDLKELCSKNYKIKSCEAFDMFPQTSHVETVAHLSL